jgi:hypothetical protein
MRAAAGRPQDPLPERLAIAPMTTLPFDAWQSARAAVPQLWDGAVARCRRWRALCVQAHGGSIGVDTVPGVWTEFHFELPLAAAEEPAATPLLAQESRS